MSLSSTHHNIKKNFNLTIFKFFSCTFLINIILSTIYTHHLIFLHLFLKCLNFNYLKIIVIIIDTLICSAQFNFFNSRSWILQYLLKKTCRFYLKRNFTLIPVFTTVCAKRHDSQSCANFTLKRNTIYLNLLIMFAARTALGKLSVTVN